MYYCAHYIPLQKTRLLLAQEVFFFARKVYLKLKNDNFSVKRLPFN